MPAVRTWRQRQTFADSTQKQTVVDYIAEQLELLHIERFQLETQPPAWAEALHERMRRMDEITTWEATLRQRLGVILADLPNSRPAASRRRR